MKWMLNAASHAPIEADFSVENLECRHMLSGAGWGQIPILIGQKAAVRRHPTITGAGESIVVMDTGINYSDPLLGGGKGGRHKIRVGFNFVNDTNTIPPDDDPAGHGTAIAGIIGANSYTYRGRRYQGIAPGANIIDLRIDNDQPNNPTDAEITQGLDWVVAHKSQYNIVSVNISDGGNTVFSTHQGGLESDDLATLAGEGCLVAVASGNDSTTAGVEYPAADANAVSVGAITYSDQIASFTSRGPTLDLLAPGDGVVSTAFNSSGVPLINPANTGTSFACPFVAGLAALLKQANPSLTVQQELEIMQDTGTPITDTDSIVYRRINIDAAINAAISGPFMRRLSTIDDLMAHFDRRHHRADPVSNNLFSAIHIR